MPLCVPAAAARNKALYQLLSIRLLWSHHTQQPNGRRIKKKQKWQKSQRGWIKAQKCIVKVCLQMACKTYVLTLGCYPPRVPKHGSLDDFFFCNSFVCLEWVQQEARGDVSALSFWLANYSQKAILKIKSAKIMFFFIMSSIARI